MSYWWWNTKNKKSFKVFVIKKGEYLTNLYLKSDVILLADVSEEFIKNYY